MASLYDKISYNHQLYSELNDPVGKQEIDQLVVKLKKLEKQIVDDPKGTITIMKSGNVFTTSFEPGLAAKIAKIVTGYR